MKSRLARPFEARLQMALWREKTYSTLQRCCVCCVCACVCKWLGADDNYIIGPVVCWTVLIGTHFFTHICISNLVSFSSHCAPSKRVIITFSSLVCSDFNFKLKSLDFFEPRAEQCGLVWANESGLPWWLRWLRISLNCRRHEFDPWVGKIHWRGKWLPIPVLLPGNPMDKWALWATLQGSQRVGYNWAAKTIVYLLNESDNLGADYSFSYHLEDLLNFFTIWISVLNSKSKRAFERHFVHYTKSSQSVLNYVFLTLICSKLFSLQYCKQNSN